MAILQQFSTLVEKQNCFHYNLIENEKDLPLFIETPEKMYYRGMNEAKYKNYSSAQRQWIGKELHLRFGKYDVFINKLIDSAKKINNGFIVNQLSTFGTNSNELTLLSFLQHYGAPTPLIDFTMNRLKALFFAVDNAKYEPSNGLDNYISVYGIKANQGDLTNLRNVLSDTINSFYQMQSEHNLPNEVIDHAKTKLETFAQAVAWETMLCINDNDASTNDYKIGINSNTNIVAQEGLFILNPESDKPIEELFDGITITSPVDKKIIQRLFYGKMYCWDIHKSLIAKILSILESNNINKSTIYPENKEIALNIYHNVLE